MFLEDGQGTGRLAHVDGSNRTVTRAEMITMREVSSILGNASYFFSSGVVTLTTGGESGVLYVKNLNPNQVLVVTNLSVFLGISTGAPGLNVTMRAYANPTSGTLLTGGTSVSAGNSNFGSTVPAQATVIVGAEGLGVVAAAPPVSFIIRDNFFNDFGIAATLPVGTAAALTIDPAAGNTSMLVTVTVAGFYITNDF